MDGCELIQTSLAGTELPDAHHLRELFVADEGLVDLEDGLLEDEVHWITQDLLRIRLYHMLPDLLIQREFYTLPRILVETLEVTPVHTHSISICASQTQIALNLTGNVVSLHDAPGTLLTVLEIGVHVTPEDIFRLVEEAVLLLQLCVLGHA